MHEIAEAANEKYNKTTVSIKHPDHVTKCGCTKTKCEQQFAVSYFGLKRILCKT